MAKTGVVPPEQSRAWHVDKTDGLGEVIVAEACVLEHGVLAFYRMAPTGDPVLVRALAPSHWAYVKLVDTAADGGGEKRP